MWTSPCLRRARTARFKPRLGACTWVTEGHPVWRDGTKVPHTAAVSLKLWRLLNPADPSHFAPLHVHTHSGSLDWTLPISPVLPVECKQGGLVAVSAGGVSVSVGLLLLLGSRLRRARVQSSYSARQSYSFTHQLKHTSRTHLLPLGCPSKPASSPSQTRAQHGIGSHTHQSLCSGRKL